MLLSGLYTVNALYSQLIVLHIYIFKEVLPVCNKKQYRSTLYDGFESRLTLAKTFLNLQSNNTKGGGKQI